MQPPKQKGKRRFINALSPDTSDTNINRFQKIMKRVNNCKASSWKCSACPLSVSKKCYSKAARVLLIEALKKYGDTPQMKRAVDERLKQEKNKKVTETLGSDK